MSKNRKQAWPIALFEKKFAICSLAGAAALMIPAAAKANIVYVGDVDHTVGFQGSYSFDDITIFTNFYNGYPEVAASTGNGAEVLMYTPNSDVAALGLGQIIDPANPLNGTAWGNGGKMAAYGTGQWSDLGDASYLGFYFEGPDGPQAGWAEIETTASNYTASFEVLSYAYETRANTPIRQAKFPSRALCLFSPWVGLA